ncbi:ras-associating and dilute domain-containing protein [Cololabis saira]|uniref:ras-associating and dilute domain-containing protein n=1 Tax=Cololabis saira TaxID=129043 RepID=UPI002AD546A1|nr:ras-associating and dilute domain-containing protein [Cololabis saira]
MNEMNKSSEELHALPPRPPSFPEASSKRRFVRLGRKTSDGSQQSGSSTCRLAEEAAARQLSKSHIRRHNNRLSGVFLRRPAAISDSMALTSGLKSSRTVQARKGSILSADVLPADDPSELSNQITAPGILKIFGNEICEGAHYKSVLATTHSSAKELVKEALERYGLSKEEAESYVLCDTIGSIVNHEWRTEGLRVLGDHEKPLLLQSLWKPREGLARRFEIQRRSLIEEKTSKEQDTITAGINAQARKLQKSRSRVSSTLVERTMGRGLKLWRSKSEMDLLDTDTQHHTDHDAPVKDRCESLDHSSVLGYEPLKTGPEQNPIHSFAVGSEGGSGSGTKTEALCLSRPRGEQEGEESEREETESSDDNTTQYSIHPPHDCPYLLLLQGCSLTQDFVIYLLAATNIVIGHQRGPEDRSKADILLSAADILPKHCYLHRAASGGAFMLCPYKDAVVTRNGKVLRNEVKLNPGDVIGLGRRYLFLFKDPSALIHKEVNSAALEPSGCPSPWTTSQSPATQMSQTAEMILCNSCILNCTDLHSSSGTPSLDSDPPFLKSPEGHSLTLNYRAEDEDRIVKEIVAMVDSCRPPLTVPFLLSMCLQYSSAYLQTSDLRRLLLLIASHVQSAMWEHTKDFAGVQPEVLSSKSSNPEHPQALDLDEIVSGLRPLVVWMSNSLELLQFVQNQLPLILEWRSQKEQSQEDEGGEWEDDESKEALNLVVLELCMSAVRSASEETMAVLEEVIMLAFQQCVYYITKFLYPVLPGLLDCNPFRESPHAPGPGDGARVLGGSGLQVPGEIQQVVEVLNRTWTLLSDCHVHQEISSQLIGYLFYFINASLFNSFMERGSEPAFYHWSRGVRMRANLDMLLDWAHAAGLGELALEHTHTLSSAINLLATPRKKLLKTSWASLRSDFPALSPAQLNHLLSLYSPASPCRHTWSPSAQDLAAARETADILESFDTHHPLVLPDDGYRLQLRSPLTESALMEQLHKLKEFISTISDSQLKVAAAKKLQVDAAQTNILQDSSWEAFNRSPEELTFSQAAIPSCLSPSTSTPRNLTPRLDELSYGDVHILTQKLMNLELQSRQTETSNSKRSALEPSCLLTPPNTPHMLDALDLLKADQNKLLKDEILPQSSALDPLSEDGLVFECLAALKADRLNTDHSNVSRLVELKEEEEELDEEEEADYSSEEVFSLELERGKRGLGLALVDTRDTSLKVKGIFISTVLPDSPAARCKKLVPGDRILAVNGVSLLGLDYQSGRELIQSSGARPRLLLARSHLHHYTD